MRHDLVAVVFCEAKINSAGEERGEKNKTFRGGNEAEGLIDIGAGGGGQMREGDPDEHQPACGVEFQAASHHCLRRRRGGGGCRGLRDAWPSQDNRRVSWQQYTGCCRTVILF